MIQVLCYSCSTHLANTDVARLDWPLTGEMFTVIYPGWFLRPGPLNLDLFCPACGQFPFSHDPFTAGGNAVGKNLNVRGVDGKPVVMTVKQILMGTQKESVPVGLPVSLDPSGSRSAAGVKPASPFPCPSCGAKKRFHKKGCIAKARMPTPEIPGEAPAIADPHLLAMESRVSSGPERSEEPTAQDLRDLERDRATRCRPEPQLRPGGGYAPKAVG